MPRFYRWYASFGVALFAAGFMTCLVGFLLKSNGPAVIMLLCALAFAAMGYLCLRSLHASRPVVTVSEDGLWYGPPNQPPLVIPWDEIATLRAHDVLQRLVVVDFTGTRTIRLEYQIQGFGELRQIILDRAIRRRDNTPPVVFHLQWGAHAFFIVGIAFFGGCSYPAAAQGCAVWFLGFAVLTGIAYVAALPWTVRVLPDRVVLRYPFHRRQVPLSEVTRIDLRNVPDSNGNLVATVFLERQGRRAIKLQCLREGSLAVYRRMLLALGAAREERYRHATKLSDTPFATRV